MTVVGAVVVAAGRGERFGGDRPKALIEVIGRPLVAHAVAGLRAAGIRHLVVVHTPDHREAFAGAVDDEVVLVPGGSDRSASVRAGLAALHLDVDVVAVHDAARAFVPPSVVRAAVSAVGPGVLAAAPAVPVADTLKRVVDGEVRGTIDRSDLAAVQTPQVFPREVLEQVIAGDAAATDDLALVERARDEGRLDGRIVLVPGSFRAHKITYAADLALAEVLARTDAG